MARQRRRLVAVSNRLPASVDLDSQGQWVATPSVGGLVTALTPILQARGGVWVGWPGTQSCNAVHAVLNQESRKAGYLFADVDLSPADIEGYYQGFSNEILWPLFHDFIWLCNFDPAYWPVYLSVNQRFAERTATVLRDDDFVWIHDYHLILVGAALRRLNVRHRIGYFLHIPFPSPDIYLKLPWRDDILEALLAYDLIGFQTERDVRNFFGVVEQLRPNLTVVNRDERLELQVGSRAVRVGAFPIGIDFDKFTRIARSETVKDWIRAIRSQLRTEQIMIGVDRLDYTKGIPRRLEAFREALTEYPELRQKLTYLQVVVPSRADIKRYSELKQDIERLVGEINGFFTQSGWIPIHYMYRALAIDELLAYYRCSDIALVTPLKDGMNLVAKEFCACTLDNDGVLILSEFTGSSAELGSGALVVNPFDRRAVAKAIHTAFTMSTEERRHSMTRMRQAVRHNDVYRWVNSFVEAAF